MALMTGPVSPYVTPDVLAMYPTGVSWNTVPDQRASAAEKYAAQVLLCQTATGMADTRANQILRATIQPETSYGPDYRATVEPNGTLRLILSQWPILAVTGVRVAPAGVLPYQFVTVPAGQFAPEHPPLTVTGTSTAGDAGTGGQTVIVGPGFVDWSRGRRGFMIQTTYEAGWPHCGITTQAAPGDQVLRVDDCTGWAPVPPSAQGATGVVQDTSSGNQEAVTVLAASATTGPGVLDLAAPLQYGHAAGVLVTCMPNQIQWATALYAGSQALARGATATTIQTVRGGSQRSTSGNVGLKDQADKLLFPFRRVY